MRDEKLNLARDHPPMNMSSEELRAHLRKSFRRALNDLEAARKEYSYDNKAVISRLNVLRDKAERLFLLDEHVLMSWHPTSPEELKRFSGEFAACEQDREDYRRLKSRCDGSEMRRNHLAGILVLSIFTWVVIIYMVLHDRPQHSVLISPETGNSLGKLEAKIKEEYEANAQLLDDVKKVLETQRENNEIIAAEKAEQEEEERKEDERRLQSVSGPGVVAVLVFACSRVTVTRCLDQLIKYRPNRDQFPIIVSQDCQHQATSDAIDAYSGQVFHIKQPDQSDIYVPPKEKKFKGYFKIARHYGWALNQTFRVYNFSTTIIIEDDLDVSPDIFSYFLATLPLLQQDPTLWCVSAWNDNGKFELVDVNSPELLHRTDFFPGLGWMLTKDTWLELSKKWPPSYWDDWIRQPEQRKERACIRPEVSRTRTFGKIGVSNGLFFEKHLKYIHLNDKYVDFLSKNLSYLLKDNYDAAFVKSVYESPIVTHQELRSGNIAKKGPVRIPYNTKTKYKIAARSLGLMDDFRSGVPRTGYRGVVSFFYKGRRVYLAPNLSQWGGYDISWS